MRELFGGWQRFWGGGLGVLSSWRCQLKKQPQWVKILRWDFPGSASVFGWINPLIFCGFFAHERALSLQMFQYITKEWLNTAKMQIYQMPSTHQRVWLDPRDVNVLWQVNGFVIINRWEVVAWTGRCTEGDLYELSDSFLDFFTVIYWNGAFKIRFQISDLFRSIDEYQKDTRN